MACGEFIFTATCQIVGWISNPPKRRRVGLLTHRQAVGLVRRVGILAHQNAQFDFRQPEQYILPLYYILPLW
ncbi:MAG: hypothetical protein J5680_07695 [Neisseriaceae bacterium]|nr:hypothetical protein [Neisseriaceae bacterium]